MAVAPAPIVRETVPEYPLDDDARDLIRIVDLTSQIIEVLDRAVVDGSHDSVTLARLRAIRDEEAMRIRDLEPLLRAHLHTYGSRAVSEPW